jgi:two-component system CheB/CheR fusion protein
LDLVSCRNLLIYLKTDTQRKVLSLFQYALKDGGYLFLGPSENIGDFGGYFAITDRKWRLFRRSPLRGLPPTEVEFFQTNLLPQTMIISPDGRSKPRPEINRRELIEQALLNYRPLVGILVDENYDILYSYGKVDLYMRMVPGESRLNILDMARSGLQIEVTTAIRQVLVHQKPVQRSQIRVKTNGDEKLIDFTVKPISTSVPTIKLVVVII